MTNNASKRRILFTVTAVLIAVALLLSCVLTAFFYTRTNNTGTGTVAEGDGADEVYGLNNRGYGTSIYNGATPAIPSGATGYPINSESALSGFLSTAVANSGTTYYGYLTANFTVGEKPVTNRVLPANATLDGNGYTITSEHSNLNAYNLRKINSAIGSRDSYLSWWGIDTAGGEGNYDVQIYSGVDAYGLSNVISVNYGTIKNLNTVVTRVDGGSDDIQAIYISPWNGNVMMGGIAGINFGVIYNCTMENEIKYGFIPSQYYVNGSNASDRGDISYQEFSAVGGIAGYNGVNPSDSSQTGSIYGCKVVVNDVLGLFRSEIAIRGRWAWDNYIEVPSNSITSGVAGGVAAINNGGIVSGVNLYAEYRETYENYTVLCNTPRHSSKSYTGVITGITNITSSPIVLELNGQNWTFAPSTVTNITLETDYLYIKAEAHDMTDLSRGSYGVLNSAQFPEAGNYAGIVCGQGTTNSNVNFVASYGGDLASAQNVNFRTWNAKELNSSQPITSADIPKFGYGTNNTNDYINEITSISTRFEGQRLDSNGTDLTSVGATVSYVWDAEQQTDGSWISGLRQNIDFTNISGINGSTYYIYGTQSYVNGNASCSNGKAIYDSSNVTYGGLAVISSSATSSSIEYNYSILFENFTDTNALNAFAGGGSDSSFAYAYANAVKLTRENTLSSPSLTGDKVMKNWKTLDGNGQTLILNDTATNVSGSSVQVSVGGQNVVGLSDLISVNYGTIKNLNVYYGTSSRTDTGSIISTNSFAYGRVAGINYGTLQNVNVNNGATVGDGSPTNIWTNSSFGAVGLAVGVNAGTIDTLHTIVWRNLSATASAFAAAGGAVGMNDGGTLKNVIVDGVASASVRATASGGESFVGGILGAGSNYGSWTSGTVTVSAPSGASSSPFEDWTFVGKQILSTAESNVGMLAGRAAADPSLANNGGQAIREMVVMMPQTNSAIGWFTSETGRMSLLGKTTGVAAQSGYIATDLVVGYYAYIDDASSSYISKIYTDYNIAKGDSGVTALFTTGVYNGSSAVRSVSSISVQTENMSASAAALISFGANLSATTQSAFIPARVATTDSVFVANDGNYAPAIKLYYDYDVNLSQSASDADSSMSKTSLEAFITGDASSATGVGTHKILAAGANGATLTSDMTLGVTIVADFVKTRGLDGGGRTVTFNPSAAGGVNYDRDGETLVAVGVLASVNRTSVTNVNVAFGGSLSTNIGASYAFGGIVGVNLGTVAGTVSYNGKSVSLSGNSAYSYVGGAVGVNRGVANGVRVSYDGGSLYADNGSGTRTALGGVIGLQDSTLLSDVQVTGNGGSLSVGGNAVVGGVIGLANVSAGDSVAGVKASKTALTNIANAAYGMTLSALSGYTGLITGILSDGAVEGGSLSGIAAHYPDNISDYKLPWRTTATNTLSMYGSGTATALDGILFKVSDHSNDGGAEYLTRRNITVNGTSRSFTFDKSQITGLSSIGAYATYYYYSGDGALTTDDSYGGSPALSGNIYTTSVNGTYAAGTSYVPTLDVRIEYWVDVANGQNQQLIDFMRGESSSGYDSYAGAIRANLMSGATFTLDGSTASQRGETSSKGKKLVGSAGNVINVSGVLPTAEYDGETVAGGFFAVNKVEISDLTVSSSANLSPSGYAFGLLAGVNEGTLTDVGASFAQSVNAGASVIGGITGVNNGVVSGATVSMSGVVASYGDKISFGAVAGVNTAKISSATATLSGACTFNADKIYYGGAVGSNNGTLSNVTVTVGTAIAQSDYLSRLSTTPGQRTINLGANDLAIWGGALGYNAGTATGINVVANVNYGMNAGDGNVAAGGVVGMNDGGALSGVKATGWGGFYAISANIMNTDSKSVFVGGIVGLMNADGASKIGFVDFANNSEATLKESVFALSGGMVTMTGYTQAKTRYGYVTGAIAAVYGDIPEGAVDDVYWFIPDKLSSVEGDDAEVLPAFHGGNAVYPTYISVFGMAPSDWLSEGVSGNKADFATNSYGFTFVDSDDNPINYLTMDASVDKTSHTLTLTVYKPSGEMFVTTPGFSGEVTGSGGTGSGGVGQGGGQQQTVTVSNAGFGGIGYLTFSFESSVYALTGSAYSEFTQYMVLSFLSTKPFGTVKGSGSYDYYSYSTVDGEISRSIGDSVYRVYQVWSGATDMQIQGSNQTVTISAVPTQPLILGKGKTFNGGQTNGNKISVASSFENNIAEYTFGGDLDGVKQTYLVISEFIAINYGTFTNANVSITVSGNGNDIYRNASDVIANAPNVGIDQDVSALTGFIYGMLVGVNEGEISQLGGYSFDRTIVLNCDTGKNKYNSIFGGMIGAQSGASALIDEIGDITFGTSDKAGGITMSGSVNLVAAGGVVGIAIEGTIRNFSVNLTSESFISVTASHNTAAVGGVVGDLRGTLSDVKFESQYRSSMKISGTNANGVATLANLVGVVNSFNGTTASIERVKVIGVGYLYNGIDENGTVTTSSINLYTAGVVGMGANYGNVDAESVAAMADGEGKTKAQQVVAAYGEIIPAKLDSVYVDFEGYVRAKANTNVGMIAARLLNGVTEEARNVDTSLISNLVWQTKLEGDSLWTTNVNYADYSSAMNTNSAVAVLGYAPATIDSNTPDLRGVGMRIWLTNNLYAVNSSVADMVITWTSGGNLNASVIGDIGWQNLVVSSVYYDKSGAELSERFKTIKSYGTYGSATQTTVAVDVAEALYEIKNSSAVFPDGIYMLRLTFNEVYIYNAKQLMTFMSAGADTVKGLASTDGSYSSYANANIGIIANDLSVDYATEGSGNRAGHKYATAVTMRSDKILEGNGMTVTITTSGDIHSAVLDAKGNTPAGALLSGEYFWDYIGGLNTFTQNDLNNINTDFSIGIRAGALFLGRNLGTIQNIDFVMQNSVTIDSKDYASWSTGSVGNNRFTYYGTSLYAGIVTAVNAGTIDNCTLTLNNNVKSNVLRGSTDGYLLYKGWTNNLEYKVNTLALNGGFAGLMYGTESAHSYISNCTVNLNDGSEVRAESQVSSFSWAERRDSVYAYAGGVVGWLTSDSTVYNVTINGTGTMTAWGELDMGGVSDGFSDGNKVTSAGAIVGLNSDHGTYTTSSKDNEFGLIDGVICNWNGAAYFLSTGNNNIFYSGTSRVNYYIGAQLAGVAEQNTLNNIYFMYGIDQYKTFHQDNWYYGDNVAARQASADFLDKYNYVVSRAVQLLENNSFGYSAIYAIAQKPGGSASLTEVAYRNADGSVTVNLEDKVIDGTTDPAFTFENYANYQTAVDDSTVSGATNFSLYVASGTTYYVANQYFPRITSTMDSGGDKNLDFVGARAAAMMTVNGTADWNNLFKPNNVYIYEVGFGSDDGVELDMNDPETTAYLTFQTKSITSDVAVNISLASDSLGAQFVWEIRETWIYPDDPLPVVSYTSYYNNVTSLEQAKANNNFTRIFDRENNGADYTFTYVMGLAVKIAMDDSRYYYNEEEGVFYDSVAKIYDGTTIDDPMLYYADEDGNPINMPELGLGTVSASVMSPSYYRDNADGTLNSAKLPKSSTDKAGAYRIRISFSSEGGENSKVNTTNRTIMFADFDHIDIYTVVLPKGVTQSGVNVSKTYDGTRDYNDSVTTFSGMIGGDNVSLDTGSYTDEDAGSGYIFVANYTAFTFRYAVMNGGALEIKTATVSLFEGSDETSDYAPVTSVKTGNLTLEDNATSFYKTFSSYPGEIRKKQISLSDVDLDMYGKEFVEGGVTPPIEYDARTTYDTAAFQSGSTILSKGLSLSSDKAELIMAGYKNGEDIRFSITFLANGGGTYESSVKNYGTYGVYLNILDSGNFALYENNAETDIMYLGQLSITPYEILEANVTYVIEAGYLGKTFDNSGTIPFTFNEKNLRIIAQGGYEVQPSEYTLTVGAMYTTNKSSSTKVAAKDAGEYDIYFAISNFKCPLGNYTLDNMTVSFVDGNGNEISYFVFPKEIKLSEATKEFDNDYGADPSVTSFAYENNYGPVSGTNDVFGLEYDSLDAGSGIRVTFTNTSTLRLNNTAYTVIDVVDGSNAGTNNYFVSSTTVAKGNITPVKVSLVSATMIYNNRNYIDYREEGTEVIIKDGKGNTVDIYPAATFNNKNAASGKTVTFSISGKTIAGKNYNTLVNSTYVSSALPTGGVGFAGNYYVDSAVWNSVGEIIKNTISIDDIKGNITIIQVQESGSAIVSGSDYLFENLAGKSYTYRYGYIVGYEINSNAFILADDKLEDHVKVNVTNTTNNVNGYAGTYTIELVIQGNDYDWDESVSESSVKVTNFTVNKQTLTSANVNASLPTTSYTYKTSATTIVPTFSVTDNYGRTITSTDGLSYTLTAFTNSNEYFSMNTYRNGSVLDVGDYYFRISPRFSTTDNLNYSYSGSGKQLAFYVTPYRLTQITATKEFDNTTSFTTSGNEAVFGGISGGEPFTPAGSFGVRTAGSRTLNLDYVETTINGTTYKLLRDANGSVTNNTWSAAVGTINKYTISASELNSYILGWVKDNAERQLLSTSSGNPQLEYRSDSASGYTSEHFMFDVTGMKYGFTATRNAASLTIIHNGGTIDTLYFRISLTGAGNYTFGQEDLTNVVLPAGVYSVSVSIEISSYGNFTLGSGAGKGNFTIEKQEISGGDASGSANVFITLGGDFSYIYGETGFNLPTVEDAKFVYTMSIIDKYTGKTAATYTNADAVIGLIEFTTAADSTDFLTSLDGTQYVGGYYVWASEFAEEVLLNYSIPEGSRIAVYIEGTAVPEIPDSGEDGETGSEGGEGEEGGDTVVIPSLAAAPAYFILPRPLNVRSVAKTYDGTNSFKGAVLTSDALSDDNITAELLGGVYASPNANYDSTGTIYIAGNKGSDYLKINVTEVTVNGNVYYTLATGGIAGNYCLTGEYTDGVMSITGAKIMRKAVGAENFKLTSDTFESVYGSDAEPELPEVIAEFEGSYETVTYTVDNVIYKQGGEIVETPVNVGGYEMYLTGIAFDNYEVTGGLSEVLVNAGRNVGGEEGDTTGGDATGGDTTGGETTGETGGEGEEGGETEETPEVWTYYIVPQKILISRVVKFYDKSTELAYYVNENEGVSADVTVTDEEGNEIVDAEGNPIVLRVQGRFVAAGAGKNKDVLVDFTPFGYYVNFEATNVAMYYRLIVIGEDGTAGIAGNYCIAASKTAVLPAQFDEDYVPEDPENDDTPVVNNGLVYNMTLVRAGTEIPAPLTVEGVTKVYDGTFDITAGTVSGLLEGDEGLKIAKWRYDDKNAGADKTVYIETDGVAYVYGDVTYYAVYMITDGEDGEKILSNYGVAAAETMSVDESTTDEEGNESIVSVMYAVVEGTGTINRLELTGANFSGVSVAGIAGNRTEYRSDKTYGVADIRATLAALGYSAQAVYSNGKLTVIFPNNDELAFTATFGDQTTAHNAGTYPITLTLTGEGNYYMSAPYTVNFVIERQSITQVYVITGALEKTYDGTGDLPVYDNTGWQIYAVDKQGVVIDMSTFGETDLSGASVVFVRYVEEDDRYEYYSPVNVTADPGYQIYVTGISLDGENYVFTSTEDAFGCMTFDQQSAAYEIAYYKINPLVVTLEDGAFDSKKFDGSFSLRKEGVPGETVVIGDKGGVNASLAGTYGDLEITPYIGGVSVSDEALNQDSVAQNYVLYYGGDPVTDATVLTVTDYTVTQADVLVAERENGVYAVGISGLQGLDFLFAKSADITDDARGRIVDRLTTGEMWTGGSFDSSSDFTKLNRAVFSVISLYVNNSVREVLPSVTDSYVADNFVYTAQDDGYSLSFTFRGTSGYDQATATDRYAFVVTGLTSAVNSTNTSVTSSELESGQLTGAEQGTGIAVSTAAEFKEAIGNNQTFYLTNSIYGVDMSDAELGTFTGTLDGRGYTVSLTGGVAKSGSSAGMLVPVNGGTIENLVVKIMPSAVADAAYVGGIAGTNNGVISNVSVELVSPLTATGATYVGGIAGYNAAGAQMTNVSFVYSANVSASGAAYGAIVGNNAGTLAKVAVRVNESAGAGNYAITASGAGLVAGASSGTVNGVIVAVPSGRITGANVMFANGGTADNVYSYQSYDGASGGELTLLEPYPDGYIGYYFATADDFTTNGMKHNELTAADEYNKSYYVDYTGDADGYIAVEAIAPYNRFIWEGYGISYRTAFGDGNVGSALNRIVALFAAGGISGQFDGTTVITLGVNAFTVAIGVRGGTVEVEGDVETSVKEVVYTGVAQIYKVNITVTSGGVSETRELSVSGTDAGYYSKASLEGIIGGGADGETIGDVTYDSGSRTEYTFSGGGTTVANGIALVIYPKQTDASGVTATKYYDTTSAGTLTVKDGETVAGTLDGNYYNAAGATTSQVAAAEKFGFATFANLTRSVLAKDGVLYEITEKISGEGENQTLVREIQPITIGSGDQATTLTTSATVSSLTATYGVRELMIAMSRLADEDYATSVLTQDQLQGYGFVKVYNLTANVSEGADNVATVSGDIVMTPVLSGEKASNYSLYSAQWTVTDDMTIGADEQSFAPEVNALTVAGRILPVDLGVIAHYTVGADQSYNFAMLDPAAQAEKTVGVTKEEAAALGISAENYDELVAEVEAGITVSFDETFFDGLEASGVLEERADGKYYATAEYSRYCSAELPATADGGNFVVTMADNTVTFRYFGTTLKDGEGYYTLTSADDYNKWVGNETGTADYYAIDMLLTCDIDFGGAVTDMLAWRVDGNVTGYAGTFDGNGFALTNMILDREGSAALFERIDEGAVVRNLTVADTLVISTGTGSVAGGIAVDNYGTVENCAFEGVLSATAKTGGIAATNYGTITGGVSVNRAYVDEGGASEGIAANADNASGETGTADGVSVTESVTGSGESAVEDTTIENADGTSAEWNEETLVPVITAYVFDERYVKVNGGGKFVTDNFLKLSAVDKLFGWVGADMVTATTQTGFYGSLTLG